MTGDNGHTVAVASEKKNAHVEIAGSAGSGSFFDLLSVVENFFTDAPSHGHVQMRLELRFCPVRLARRNESRVAQRMAARNERHFVDRMTTLK